MDIHSLVSANLLRNKQHGVKPEAPQQGFVSHSRLFGLWIDVSSLLLFPLHTMKMLFKRTAVTWDHGWERPSPPTGAPLIIEIPHCRWKTERALPLHGAESLICRTTFILKLDLRTQLRSGQTRMFCLRLGFPGTRGGGGPLARLYVYLLCCQLVSEDTV